jgi:hypothetical protein
MIGSAGLRVAKLARLGVGDVLRVWPVSYGTGANQVTTRWRGTPCRDWVTPDAPLVLELW